jgi:hypothetical protein
MNDNLPPLPPGTRPRLISDWTTVYTEEEMREYARAAIVGPKMRALCSESVASALSHAAIAQAAVDRIVGLQGFPVDREPQTQGSPWLPINSAPKDGSFLIVFGCFPGARTSIAHFGFWHSLEQRWCGQSNRGPVWLENVTYWMPRPPRPVSNDKPAQCTEGDRPNV